MKRKKLKNKKPPTGATGSGKSEKQSGRDVFCVNNSTYPVKCQTDYAKQADTFRQQANYFSILADIADHMRKVTDLQEQAKLSLMPIYTGGTVYQIQGKTDEN